MPAGVWFFARMGHLVDMARTGHVKSGHGSRDPLHRAGWAPDRLRDRGRGPTVLFGGRWISHLEEDWADPGARDFFEDLAPTHRVVRYDRLGVGLFRPWLTRHPRRPELGAVLDACGGGPAALFGCSCAGLAMASFARDFPERVSKLVFFGGYAARDDIPDATRGSIIDFVRVNWPLASQMLAGLLVPRASGAEIAAFSRYMRLAADAEVAASSLEDDLTTDARAVLPAGDHPRPRSPPPRRPRRADRPGPGARIPAPECPLHRVGRRRPPALDGRPARRAARVVGLPRGRPGGGRRRRQPAQRQGVRRCCGSSQRGSRTARSPARCSSASTPCTGTSRTS